LGVLAYNLRTVSATEPKLCVLEDIVGPHLLQQNKGFTKGRIATAWNTGKVYDFLFGFSTVNFVLALQASAKRSCHFHVKIWLRNSK